MQTACPCTNALSCVHTCCLVQAIKQYSETIEAMKEQYQMKVAEFRRCVRTYSYTTIHNCLVCILALYWYCTFVQMCAYIICFCELLLLDLC